MVSVMKISASVTPTTWEKIAASSSDKVGPILFSLVYTEHQCQCCANSVMILAIVFLLKTMESHQNGIATHFQETLLFSLRTVSLVLSQSCCCIDADAWCKWTLKINLYQSESESNFFFDICRCYCRFNVNSQLDSL